MKFYLNSHRIPQYKRFLSVMLLMLLLAGGLCACAGKGTEKTMQNRDAQGDTSVQEDASTKDENAQTQTTQNQVNYTKLFKSQEQTSMYKGLKYHNPLMTQEFGADPYAMVYQDTLYLYMTQDAFEKNAAGVVQENTYSKIRSIRVISTRDMVNWTDHGEIYVAGNGGRAKWARNSWAPAVAWKNIDGKDQFFLYFADAGGGIGVLQGESPVGPFTDPLGKGLITRDTPNCGDIVWLFDPAVLVDDDGRAYLYFGGGVPEGQAEHPGTARVVELGDDMISMKGEPVIIDAPYLFEDSGIHKVNDRYYYTYCSNWQVDEAATEKYGFTNAEIVSMESDSPMGPFKLKETVLDNPGSEFGLYGNNHHCIFSFRDQWYIAYHTRVLEQEMGVEKGYRCTFIDKIDMGEDGTIGRIRQTIQGVDQIGYPDPYEEINACTFSHQAGLTPVPSDMLSKSYGAGDMALGGIHSGDYLKISDVDFSHKSANQIYITAARTDEVDENCVIQLRLDSLKGDILANVPIGELLNESGASTEEFTTITFPFKQEVNGVHNLYMIFAGENYELLNWQVEGSGNSWYDDMLSDSLVSTGTNGRLERALKRMKQGEPVKVAFIGGSVTEGGGVSDPKLSYADRVVENLRKEYSSSDITYCNAGLGGTPSALGVMRYERDVIDVLGDTPDILFIEFSVNDYQEATGGAAFESLVRRALQEDPDTAVCLVFAVFKSKWNLQELYIPVGEAYGLAMSSAKDAIVMPYEEGYMTDGDYFSDDYHPTAYGHSVMADCITYMLQQAAGAAPAADTKAASDSAADPTDASASNLSPWPDKPVLGDEYTQIEMITATHQADCKVQTGGFKSTDTQVHGSTRESHSAFSDNWMHTAKDGSDAFTMEFTGRNVLINYKQSSADTAGSVEVYLDDKKIKIINSQDPSGWNQSVVDVLFESEEAASHTLKIAMKPGDEQKEFTILALAVSK